MSKTPDTITAIQMQIGRGIGGGFIYVGASQLTYRCPRADGECRPAFASSFDTTTNNLKFDVGLQFNVNGKRGQDWQITVCYEMDDTYTVYLTGKVKQKGIPLKVRELFETRADVYCDEVQSVVEKMYDDACKKYNGGFCG